MSIRPSSLYWHDFDEKLHQQVVIQGNKEDFYAALTRSYNRLIQIQSEPLKNQDQYDEIQSLYETAKEVNHWMLDNFGRYSTKRDHNSTSDANGIPKNRAYFKTKQENLAKVIGFFSEKLEQAQAQLEKQQKGHPEDDFVML